MKYYLTLASIFLSATLTYAQQTVKRSGNISGVVFEKYSVLKADKKVKQGEYTATYNGKVVARGNYTNGQRTGEWNFYGLKDKLVQTFNYDTNKFTFLDTADFKDVKYTVESTNPGDVITAPIKIGGVRGITAITIARTELQRASHGDLPGAMKVYFEHTLVVDAKGQIVDHIVKAKGDNNMEKVYHLNDTIFDPEVTRFIPATVNGQPVMSKVTLVITSVSSGLVTRTY